MTDTPEDDPLITAEEMGDQEVLTNICIEWIMATFHDEATELQEDRAYEASMLLVTAALVRKGMSLDTAIEYGIQRAGDIRMSLSGSGLLSITIEQNGEPIPME